MDCEHICKHKRASRVSDGAFRFYCTLKRAWLPEGACEDCGDYEVG